MTNSNVTYSPDEAASSFSCIVCGLTLRPMLELSETTIESVRKSGFTCAFCEKAFTGDSFTGTYENYLKSTIWRDLRAAAIERAGGRCQICNSDLLLQVHHRKYPSSLGWEHPEDLTVLCRRCHDLFHNVRNNG
jgi:hypothetical protein